MLFALFNFFDDSPINHFSSLITHTRQTQTSQFKTGLAFLPPGRNIFCIGLSKIRINFDKNNWGG